MSVDMPVFDNRIDEAARQLTEGAPDAGFKARVLARIEERPRSSKSRVWLLVPAAAAAIVVVAIVMPRQEPAEIRLADEIRSKPDTTVATKDAVRLKPDTTTANAATADVIRLKPDPTRDGPLNVDITSAAARRLDATPNSVAMPAGLDPFLPAVQAIAVEAIDVAPLDIEAVDINAIAEAAAIDVEEIAIAPLEFNALDQ